MKSLVTDERKVFPGRIYRLPTMEWLRCLPCTRVHNNHSINIISNWENPLQDSDMRWPFNLWIMAVLCLFTGEMRREFSDGFNSNPNIISKDYIMSGRR